MKKNVLFILLLMMFSLGGCGESTNDDRSRSEAERTPANDMGTTTTGQGTSGTSGAPDELKVGTDSIRTGTRDTIR